MVIKSVGGHQEDQDRYDIANQHASGSGDSQKVHDGAIGKDLERSRSPF